MKAFVIAALAAVISTLSAIDGPGAGSSSPGPRNAHAMAYDERRECVLLFGGADRAAVRGDTWAWDGQNWERLHVTGPSPRTFPAIVWDAARSEVVLFGGRRVLFGRATDTDTFLADTWALAQGGWQLRARTGPPPRSEAGFSYDRARRVVVMFGGYHEVGGQRVRLGDTWEWDGTRWQLRARSGPEPRSGIAMAYDERLRRVVLFGGSGGPRSDTWTWDGRVWERVRTATTAGRFNSIAAYDAVRQVVVRTTGWSGTERVRETWLFQGFRWQLASSGGPSARNHSAAAFDRRRGRLVLHGGHDGTLVFGDTWEWDGDRWISRVTTEAQPRIDNGH